jgi:hypothetical protein
VVRDIITALTWLQWALLALFVVAAVLALIAWTGERRAPETMPARPLPLPEHRPEHVPAPAPEELDEYAARHSQELMDGPTRRLPGTLWIAKDRQQVQWPWRG